MVPAALDWIKAWEESGPVIADNSDTREDFRSLTDEEAVNKPVISRGKEFKAQYYGPSNLISTTDYAPGR